jgi:hypothetical protein
LANSHRPVIPQQYGTEEWFDQFQTVEEIDCEICCLLAQAKRLRWHARMDALKAQRLLFVDLTSYRFYMQKSLLGKEAADQFELWAQILQERKERIIEQMPYGAP